MQRLLACRSRRDSQRALMLDASVIVLQFAFFLVLGLCLYAFYGGVPYQALGLRSSDEIFPKFIVENLPAGIAGLVIAGVLASAMGTLSSSISSLASATFLDLFRPIWRGRPLDQAAEVRWSRLLTLFWGVVLIGGALLFTDTRNPVVELGLKIASFTYGGLLGTFFLGLLTRRTTEADGFVGFSRGASGDDRRAPVDARGLHMAHAHRLFRSNMRSGNLPPSSVAVLLDNPCGMPYHSRNRERGSDALAISSVLPSLFVLFTPPHGPMAHCDTSARHPRRSDVTVAPATSPPSAC